MNTSDSNLDNASKYSFNITYSPDSKECGIVSMPLSRESHDFLRLQEAGYEIVFPEPLSEKAVSAMSEQERAAYYEKLSLALIINPQEGTHSLEEASVIAKHHYSCGAGVITGVDPQKNSLTIFPHGDFAEQSHVRLNDLFNKLGYPSEVNGIEVEVASDIPYQCVTKTKLQELFTRYIQDVKTFFNEGKEVFEEVFGLNNPSRSNNQQLF